MSLADYIPIEFVPLFSNPNFAEAIKGFTRYLINEDEEFRVEISAIVNHELDNSFDARLAASELRPIKRIAKLEVVTGQEDYYDPDEEHEPTLQERLQNIEAQISGYEFRPTINPLTEKEPTTKTEMRASRLVDALKASGKDYFTANEIVDFLKCKLPESCKIDSTVKNIRKVKQDVINTARLMFPNIELNKKKTGHREVRLILRS